MKKRETILLTGRSGFIGSKILKALRKEGYQVKPFVGDVRKATNWLASLKKDLIIFHIAGIKTETKKDFEVNSQGTAELFKAIIKSKKVPSKIVLASSQAVYRGNKPPFKETMIPKPTTIYGKSKLRAEKIAQKYCRTLKIPLIIFRYSGVLGPGIREKSAMSWPLPLWLKNGRLGQPIIVNFGGEQTRDYVHVNDVVAANLLAVGKLPSGIYNTGGGRPVKVLNLARWVWQKTGQKSKIVIKKNKPSAKNPMVMFSDISKLRSYGWQLTKKPFNI